MIRIASWLAVFTVVLVALATVWLAALPRDPFRQPGVSWSWGFLSGYTVRLLDSGRYVDSNWCDICQEERSFGTWRATADGYELVPDSGKPRWQLLRIGQDGCARLIGPPARRGGPVVYFRRDGDACEPRVIVEQPRCVRSDMPPMDGGRGGVGGNVRHQR